jgi:hypothetical protein
MKEKKYKMKTLLKTLALVSLIALPSYNAQASETTDLLLALCIKQNAAKPQYPPPDEVSGLNSKELNDEAIRLMNGPCLKEIIIYGRECSKATKRRYPNFTQDLVDITCGTALILSMDKILQAPYPSPAE